MWFMNTDQIASGPEANERTGVRPIGPMGRRGSPRFAEVRGSELGSKKSACACVVIWFGETTQNTSVTVTTGPRTEGGLWGAAGGQLLGRDGLAGSPRAQREKLSIEIETRHDNPCDFCCC